MKCKNGHVMVMCKTLDKAIIDHPLHYGKGYYSDYEGNRNNNKITFVYSYTTNLNINDFDYEAVFEIFNNIIENVFLLKLANQDIETMEIDKEADDKYSVRFSTKEETVAPAELAFNVGFESNCLKVSSLDLSGISLNEINNLSEKKF